MPKQKAKNEPYLPSNQEMSLPSNQEMSAAVMKALGTMGIKDETFYATIIKQLGKATSKQGKLQEDDLKFVISFVTSLDPKDYLEVLLAVQMAAVHVASMEAAQCLSNSETTFLADHAERVFNKLARTFTTQVDTWKRYRSGVEQKAAIQHVSVNQGGQAIVANLSQAPASPDLPNAKEQPLAIEDMKQVPMATIGGRTERAVAAVEPRTS